MSDYCCQFVTSFVSVFADRWILLIIRNLRYSLLVHGILFLHLIVRFYWRSRVTWEMNYYRFAPDMSFYTHLMTYLIIQDPMTKSDVSL